MRIAGHKIFERHGDAKFVTGDVHRLINRTGCLNCPIEILGAIEQGDIRTVVDQLAIAAWRIDLSAETIGPTHLQVERASRLNLLAGPELNVLPDFSVYGKKLSLAEEIAHALE